MSIRRGNDPNTQVFHHGDRMVVVHVCRHAGVPGGSGVDMGLWGKSSAGSQPERTSSQKVDANGDASTSSTLSSADVTEEGIDNADFPQQQRFWQGGEYEMLGSGIRYYKLGFIHVKVRVLPHCSSMHIAWLRRQQAQPRPLLLRALCNAMPCVAGSLMQNRSLASQVYCAV